MVRLRGVYINSGQNYEGSISTVVRIKSGRYMVKYCVCAHVLDLLELVKMISKHLVGERMSGRTVVRGGHISGQLAGRS